MTTRHDTTVSGLRATCLSRITEALNEYESAHPSSNDVGCAVEFFDNVRYIWNGQRFDAGPGPFRLTAESRLTDSQFRHLLDLLMASDPWPLSGEANEELVELADAEAAARGFENWIVAFHEHKIAEATGS